VREIVFVSGKGGTGKTSFAAAFAHLAGSPVVLGDCDVDAANLALLLPGEDVHAEPFFAGQRAVVNSELCNGCGACELVCRYDAIQVTDELARVADLRCEGCHGCKVICPEDAIGFSANRAGTLFLRETQVGPLVHGALGIAQDNSGKLVAKVREDVRRVGEERGIDLAILDGPPGIGCPVHAAIGRTDLVVAVTEPSPSGAHDLERLLELTHHFDLETVVIVNKFDLNPALAAEIEALSRGMGAEPIGRVPFDEEVPRALRRYETPLAVPSVAKFLGRAFESINENRRLRV
jgi:MinD superfamily P-loop ATPase